MIRPLAICILAVLQTQAVFAQSENVSVLALDRVSGEKCLLGTVPKNTVYQGIEMKSENPEAQELQSKITSEDLSNVKACSADVQENAQSVLAQMKKGPKSAGLPLILGLAGAYAVCSYFNLRAAGETVDNIMNLGGSGSELRIGGLVSLTVCIPVTAINLGIAFAYHTVSTMGEKK